MDPLHQQGAIGGVSLSFAARKTSETDKEEGNVSSSDKWCILG